MRKLFSLIGAVLLVAALAIPSWATIGVELGYGYVTVTLDGSASFDFQTATITAGLNAGSTLISIFPKGIQITAIDVCGSAAGAKTVIRNGSSTNSRIPPTTWYTVDGGPQVQYYGDGRWYMPYIAHADNTLDTGTTVTFSFKN